MDISSVLAGYDLNNLTIASLGGHSALDVSHGVKKHGFKTLVVAMQGRDQTYQKYFKTRGDQGCVDETIVVEKFSDILKPELQEELRKRNTIFIHNRYFWVYFDDFAAVENDFAVPIYGSRNLVRLEERDQPNNQYELLEKAGIRIPKLIRRGGERLSEDELRARLETHFKTSEAPLLVKANEAIRSYERAFFIVTSPESYFTRSQELIDAGKVNADEVHLSVIEEFVLGAQVNFNFFYSNIRGELELMGTDTRRQTSLDGFLRLDAGTQMELLRNGINPSMVETGHAAVTTKESLLEKVFEAGEKFLATLKDEVPPGMIGPFALQGAVAAEKGREELVIFDVSMRIPGSPGTRFTPATGYLWGESMSYGERIGKELREAVDGNKIESLLT